MTSSHDKSFRTRVITNIGIEGEVEVLEVEDKREEEEEEIVEREAR